MIERISALLWSDVTLALLLGTGLYFTIRSRLCQVRLFGRGMKAMFGRQGKSSGGLSQFQTMSATLAATMGTGNLVGVATALTIGGAGAIFWMWLSAFLGMAVVYAENVLGTRYRTKTADGSFAGGPMGYLERGVGSKALAVCFAVCCVLVSFGMGNMAQTNAMAGALRTAFGVPGWVSGLAAAVVMYGILAGGVKRLGKAATALIPALSLCYLLGALVVLVRFRAALPDAFGAIFRGAFGISAVGGGISGAAIRRCINIGLRRGVFSNEAGLGSAPLLHSTAAADDPATQGACGMVEVFLDTIVCCTVTALVLLTSGAAESGVDGAPMVMAAFSAALGKAGGWFVSAAVTLFAVGTLIGWSCCGLHAARYLSPRHGESVYRVVFPAVCLLGATTALTAVWSLSDCFNALMLFPNIAGLLLLRHRVFTAKPLDKKRLM